MGLQLDLQQLCSLTRFSTISYAFLCTYLRVTGPDDTDIILLPPAVCRGSTLTRATGDPVQNNTVI